MSALSPQSVAAPSATAGFGELLRYWRGKRGLSQLALSGDSGISQRHISFLESGRAQPSREMVLKVSQVLDIPLRQRNALLLAAGFAPLYRERPFADPELTPVRHALEFILAQQEPYPAIVVDRLWNLVHGNRAALGMIAWLLGPDAPKPPDGQPPNVVAMMLSPQALRPMIANWPQVAADVLHWIHRETLAEPPGGPAHALLESLQAIDGVPADWRTAMPEPRAMPFLPIRMGRDGVELSFFTTIATLGTPHDVTLHELRIESFFPADDATALWLRRRAEAGAGPGSRPD